MAFHLFIQGQGKNQEKTEKERGVKTKAAFPLLPLPCISYDEWLLAGETGPTPPRKLGSPAGFNWAEGSC